MQAMAPSVMRGSGGSGLVMQCAQHGFPQDGIHAGLIAFALALEPGQDIGIDAHGGVGLDGLEKGVGKGACPECVIQLGNVAVVDPVCRLARKRLEFGLAGGAEGRKCALCVPNFAHNDAFRGDRRDGR